MVCCRTSFCSYGACLLLGWATVQTLLGQARACIDPSVLTVETWCLTDFVCCSWLLSVFVVFISSHTFTAFYSIEHTPLKPHQFWQDTWGPFLPCIDDVKVAFIYFCFSALWMVPTTAYLHASGRTHFGFAVSGYVLRLYWNFLFSFFPPQVGSCCARVSFWCWG